MVSNRPGVRALERAAEAGVAARVIDHRGFAERAGFDAALKAEVERLRAHDGKTVWELNRALRAERDDLAAKLAEVEEKNG